MNKYTSFANEAIDALAKNIRLLDIPTEYGEFAQTIIKDIDEATKFKLPDNGQLFETNELDPTETMRKFIDFRLHLPYPKIAIEFVELMQGACPDLKVLVIAEEKGDEIHSRIGLCSIDNTREWVFTDSFVASIHRDTYKVGCYFEGDHSEMEEHRRKMQMASMIMTRVLSQLLCALSCNNAAIADDSAAPSPLKQSMRKSKGRKPFYSFKVLTVKTAAANSGTKKTTGSGKGSPKRSHLRRGHIRVYEDRGLKTWVNKCMVGNASIGTVDKEYNLSPQ